MLAEVLNAGGNSLTFLVLLIVCMGYNVVKYVFDIIIYMYIIYFTSIKILINICINIKIGNH